MTRDATTRQASLRIWRGRSRDDGRYETFDVTFEEGESVLDGLVRLRAGPAPDLAFQFSCFNANVCKECVVLIDGRVDYACLAKLKAGETRIEPIPSRAIVRDLLTDSRGRRAGGLTLRAQVAAATEGKA